MSEGYQVTTGGALSGSCPHIPTPAASASNIGLSCGLLMWKQQIHFPPKPRLNHPSTNPPMTHPTDGSQPFGKDVRKSLSFVDEAPQNS